MIRDLGVGMLVIGGVLIAVSMILNRREILGMEPHEHGTRLDELLYRAEYLRLELDLTNVAISREAEREVEDARNMVVS